MKKAFSETRLLINSLSFIIILLSGVTAWSSPGAIPTAPAVPVATPTAKSSLDLEFLNLPAFDIERIIPPVPTTPESVNQLPPESTANEIKVGDVLSFKLNSVTIPGIEHPADDLTLEEPPAETSLHDQGWDLQIGAEKGAAPVGASSFFFRAIPLKSGDLTLPSLALKNHQGKNVGRTNPLTLHVATAIAADDPKPEEPEQLEPPVGLAFPLWVILAMGIFALAALVGVGLLMQKWLKNRRARRGDLPELYRSEDEIALHLLFELEQKKLIPLGKYKIFYFTMSEVLKAYLGRRFRFDAAESTTQELLNHLEHRERISDKLLDRLEALFNQLDRVKFTDFVPAESEPVGLLVEAREWIQLTRQTPAILDSVAAEKKSGSKKVEGKDVP